MTTNSELFAKQALLRRMLNEYGRVIVAFSGGVDSTLLLRVALEELGAGNVLAVMGVSAFIPAAEIVAATAFAREMGVPFRTIEIDIWADSRVVANPPDRCYYCKAGLLARLTDLAREEGYSAVVDGSNADDGDDWRPGSRAVQEYGVKSPLAAAGLTKAEIRELSRTLGLPTWDKPAAACLASRIPYGISYTPELLAAVEAAEAYLLQLGLSQVRVRHHGEIARIEAIPQEIPLLLAAREQISARLREIGFRFVALDLDGYRMGSLNANS